MSTTRMATKAPKIDPKRNGDSGTKTTKAAETARKIPQPSRMNFAHYFSTPGINPLDQVEWERRSVAIKDDTGKEIFQQKDVEVPKEWSELATKVVVSKYFYGNPKNPNEREQSIKTLINRVCKTIADWGVADGYFDAVNGQIFYNELVALCVRQMLAFNSPVWFNCGLYHYHGVGKDSAKGNWRWNQQLQKCEIAPTQYENPQMAACFIQSVEDNMQSILSLAYSEGMLFKFGSGTGSDLTPIRSSRELLSGGGKPSGPLSFLRIYDQVGNVVKSGGKTRRAAKMNTLNVTHGDIEEFIEAKTVEEKKAWALIEQGYDGSFNGDAYGSVMYQNENLSVRVTDDFMKAATGETDPEWWTYAVTTKKPLEKKDARELLDKVATGTHICGDPGIQYDSTINRWHTCKASEPIYSSNPCSEYLFLNDSACNLASLNLKRFMVADKFDVGAFENAVKVAFTAQEILVDRGSYPTEAIAVNTHRFRTIGLGYANLGGLLMSLGLPYDSKEGHALAGAITAIMTGAAYKQSAILAKAMGPFEGYHNPRPFNNRQPTEASNERAMLEVIGMHRAAVEKIESKAEYEYLINAARKVWEEAETLGKANGFRNAQATVLAPTGTIGFMMDCDTTGIEPELALVKYKLLAGGGMLTLINQTVNKALEKLGYNAEEIKRIGEHITRYGTIEDVVLTPDDEAVKNGTQKAGDTATSGLKAEHLPVFDCSFKAMRGKRFLAPMAHLKMMAAAQPFISGAISKTVNMPKETSIQEIRDTYVAAWKLGLKCVAIYRDGSKRSQPLSTGKTEDALAKKDEALELAKKEIEKLKKQIGKPLRRRLPDTRPSITHKATILDHEFYICVGMFSDGTPGEVFITTGKEGSTVSGLMDAVAMLTSMALQYGVPLHDIVKKLSFTKFDPQGFTPNPDLRRVTSPLDYIFRWLELEFGAKIEEMEKQPQMIQNLGRTEEAKPVGRPVEATERKIPQQLQLGGTSAQNRAMMEDAPPCPECGTITVRNGACFKCLNCGASLGCS